MRPINTVRAIVDAWDGTKALADWCGIGMPNVSDWLADNRIPPGWHYRLDREARRRGYLIHPKLFGDKPNANEAPILARARA